jgi:hypothetical protein
MRAGALWISEKWVEETAPSSGPDLVERARRRARELVQQHEVEPLADDVLAELDELMTQARRELLTS